MKWRVPFARPDIGEEEIKAINRVMRSGWLVAGPETEKFEKEFAEFVGVRYAIFTNSCTSALKMAYKFLKEEKRVTGIFYPKNTYSATYSAAREVGLDAIYDYQWNTDIPGYVVGVNVSYGGVKSIEPCWIEDSAHRIEPNDPLVGKIRCYSFYATKNMTTGTGGMFVTNDKKVYERARLYWKDGLTTSAQERAKGLYGYKVIAMAGGYDTNDLVAAIGRVQLRRLPEFNKKRNAVVAKYNEAFGTDWKGNHLYPYRTGSPRRAQELQKYLAGQSIQSSIHYPDTGWDGVSLPLFPSLTDRQVNYVIRKVEEFADVHKDHSVSRQSA